MSKRDRLAELALDRGGLLALAVLALYGWLAPPCFVEGDNAEFSGLSVLGGTAHPPGYPLYVMYLRAMSWLPGASPAHSAALATGVLGAAAVLALHAACRAWGARPLAATIACAMFAASPVVMTMSTEAEVFALENLTVACVLWLAAARGPVRGPRRAALLGLVAGLGIANQLTCVLVAPVGIYGVVLACRESAWRRALPSAVGGLVVGLLPYLYLLAAPSTQMSWGSVGSFGELVDVFTRSDFGGPTAFYAHGRSSAQLEQIGALVATLGRSYWWLGLVLGLVTLALRAVRRRDGQRRVPWIVLAASFLLAGPILATRFNDSPHELGLYVIERFHILPSLLLVIPIAVGLTMLGARLPERVRARERVAGALAALAGLAAAAAPSLPHVRSAHSPVYQQYAENVLHALPPDAVVITTADEIYFGGGYLQSVMGERKDVAIVNWALLVLPWYRRRVEQWGIQPDRSHGSITERVARHVFYVRRPLFIDRELAYQVKDFTTYPFATLVRVLPPGTPRPSLDEIADQNRDVYASFVLEDEREEAPWPRELQKYYAETWHILARAYDEAGRAKDAVWAEDLARRLEHSP